MHQKPLAMANRKAKEEPYYIPVFYETQCIGNVDYKALNKAIQQYDSRVCFEVHIRNAFVRYPIQARLAFSEEITINSFIGWVRPVAYLYLNISSEGHQLELSELMQIAQKLPMVLLSYHPGRAITIEDTHRIQPRFRI